MGCNYCNGLVNYGAGDLVTCGECGRFVDAGHALMHNMRMAMTLPQRIAERKTRALLHGGSLRLAQQATLPPPVEDAA